MRVKRDADRLPDSIRSNWETEEYISSLLPYLWDLPQSAEGCHARHWSGRHLLEHLPCVGKIEICISFLPWSVWSPLWSTGRSFRLDQTFGLVARSHTSQENCIRFKTNQWKDQKLGNTFAYLQAFYAGLVDMETLYALSTSEVQEWNCTTLKQSSLPQSQPLANKLTSPNGIGSEILLWKKNNGFPSHGAGLNNFQSHEMVFLF